MTETEFLTELDETLSRAWNDALKARNIAQKAMDEIREVRMSITARQTELARAELEELKG